MLTITAEQVALLDGIAHSAFRHHVAAYLRAHVREEQLDAMGDAALLDWIATRLEAAERHGVLGQRALVLWAFLAAVLGPEFHNEPAIRTYLAQPSRAADLKIDELVHALEARLHLRDS